MRVLHGRPSSFDFLALQFLCSASNSCRGSALGGAGDHAKHGAGMLHLRELQVLHRIRVVERDREVVGNLAYY